jgi:hypothetical protein
MKCLPLANVVVAFCGAKSDLKNKIGQSRGFDLFFPSHLPLGKYFTRPKGVFHPTKSDFTRSIGTDFTAKRRAFCTSIPRRAV